MPILLLLQDLLQKNQPLGQLPLRRLSSKRNASDGIAEQLTIMSTTPFSFFLTHTSMAVLLRWTTLTLMIVYPGTPSASVCRLWSSVLFLWITCTLTPCSPTCAAFDLTTERMSSCRTSVTETQQDGLTWKRKCLHVACKFCSAKLQILQR